MNTQVGVRVLFLSLAAVMLSEQGRAQSASPEAPPAAVSAGSAVAIQPQAEPGNPAGEVVPSDTLALGQPTLQPAAGAPVVASEEMAASAPTPAVSTAPVAEQPMQPPPGLQAWPKKIRYRGETEMPGYVLRERGRMWMWIAGAAMIGVPYIIGLATASESDFSNKSGFLAVPVVGPWITLTTREKGDCFERFTCDDSLDNVLIVSGVLQAAGLAMVAVGMTWKSQLWIREDLAVHIAPQQFGREGYGAAFSGTF